MTVLKAYEDPGSETLSTWLLAGIAGIFSTLSVGSFNLVLLSYPLYIVITNLAAITAIQLGKKHK